MKRRLPSIDFKLLFESVPGLYLVLTPALVIVAVSDDYLNATKTRREEILGRGLFDVFPDNPEDPEADGVSNLHASLSRVISQKIPDAMAVQKYDIRKPEAEGGGFEERYWSPKNSPVFDEGGKLAYIIHRVEDVTEFMRLKREDKKQVESLKVSQEEMATEIFLRSQELKRANEDLRRSEENEHQLRALADSMPQLVWIAQPDGVVVWYNQRWYEYTGTTPEQMKVGGLIYVHDPQLLPLVASRWKWAIDHGVPTEMEFPLRRADGEFRWFLTRVVPMKNAEGKITRWLGTNTDIDDQRKSRQQLEEALGARDEFLSIASHELKTPLTSLKLQLQMAKRSRAVPLPQALEQSFAKSLHQVDRLDRLVEELLDVSRIRAGKLSLTREKINLSELVEQLAEQNALALREARCVMQLNVEPGIFGEWDRGRLEQIFTNLISNAIKYAPNCRLKISLAREGKNAVLMVEDNGPGIPSEKQKIVFERFERATSSKNISGLGLGLFIVKRIAEAHSGKVSLKSGSGSGSKFIVELPIAV